MRASKILKSPSWASVGWPRMADASTALISAGGIGALRARDTANPPPRSAGEIGRAPQAPLGIVYKTMRDHVGHRVVGWRRAPDRPRRRRSGRVLHHLDIGVVDARIETAVQRQGSVGSRPPPSQRLKNRRITDAIALQGRHGQRWM